MLTSHKLLYILPDVAYITELLPTKKEHTFAIHSFRQINGEFLDDNEFIAENINKLINKIDADEYHLVLPDFLFTNTIVEIAETNETKVKEYLTGELLPELTLSPDTHELKTFILTQHGGKTKVQLSALEKSLMNPVSTYAKEKGIKITGVSPISWTIKSIVSLEPSISVVQMGTHVYLAQHYIGVDQAISAPVTEVETLSETIKTLKGAEPSIQTVYLITNSVVEESLKENLSGTLPLQQLASFKEEDSEMPSYVKFVIESGMRTLSLEAFPVPRFPLSAPTGEVQMSPTVTKDEDEEVEPEETATAVPEPTRPSSDTDDELDLPTPTTGEMVGTATAVAASSISVTPTTAATNVTELDLSAPTTIVKENDDLAVPEPERPSVVEKTDTEDLEEVANVVPVKPEDLKATDEETRLEHIAKPPVDEVAEEKLNEEVKPEPVTIKENLHDAPLTSSVKTMSSTTIKKTPTIIKNQSGVQPMLKKLLTSFVVFLLTIGVGVGIGYGFIRLSQQNNGGDQTSPVASATPTTTPAPTPTPTPAPEVDVSELSVLVVNATTKAGYAGTTKTALTKAEFGTVDAGNAKGDYDSGFLVLMKEENQALIEKLEEASKLELTYSKDIAVEDPSDKYDAVIVLAE